MVVMEMVTYGTFKDKSNVDIYIFIILCLAIKRVTGHCSVTVCIYFFNSFLFLMNPLNTADYDYTPQFVYFNHA